MGFLKSFFTDENKYDISNTKSFIKEEKSYSKIKYKFPSFNLLEDINKEFDEEYDYNEVGKQICEIFENYKIDVSFDHFEVGANVVVYYISLGKGVRFSKVKGLSNDVQLALSASHLDNSKFK